MNQPLTEPFRAQADALGAWFRTSSGKIPRRGSADAHEQQLSRWRYAQLTRLRDGTMPPECEKYLDRAAPGWRPPPRGPAAFRARADQLGRWMRATGTVPASNSVETDERQLAHWRYNLLRQVRDGTMPQEHAEYLDAVAPGWHPGRRRSGAFRVRADDLGRWMRSAGRVPSATGANEHERMLATWRRTQRDELAAGTLPPEREEYLDQVAPGWRPIARSGFHTQAEELGRRIRSTGKIPSPQSADLGEKRSAEWRLRQVGRLNSGTLAPEHEQYLDQVAPGWRPADLEQAFRAVAEELGRWFAATDGALPNERSADPDEMRLARWRKEQVRRLRERTMRPEREQYLDQVAPGWRKRRPTGTEGFRTWAKMLGAWLSDERVLPSPGSADPYQRRLGVWRQNRIAALSKGTLAPDRERYLDEVAPGWRPGDRYLVVFPDQAAALGRWMAGADGKVPSSRSDDAHERRLNGWRRGWLLQLRTGTLPSQHEQYLDEVAPGWRSRAFSEEDVFPARAEALGRWLACADGRLPSDASDDQHERHLHRWRRKWLSHLRNGTLPPERERYLDEVAPGWRMRRVTTFSARARALGRWMPWADGRVPNIHADDAYERRLSRWRSRWLRQLRTGTLPPQHEQYLDQVAPGWRPRASSGVDEFPARAEALGRFVSTEARLPSSRSDDLHERRMFRWRQGWLFHLRNGTLPPDREQYLDQVAPGWRGRT